jgi:glutamine amidotransferase
MNKIEYLRSAILNFIEKKRPFMGICLGMQLLYEKSEEDNFTQRGLNLFKGKNL